jgi:hypothetical protein
MKNPDRNDQTNVQTRVFIIYMSLPREWSGDKNNI